MTKALSGERVQNEVDGVVDEDEKTDDRFRAGVPRRPRVAEVEDDEDDAWHHENRKRE